jgi:DNA-binding MarR family transcriptional regulator
MQIKLQDKLVQYLFDSLGIQIQLNPWGGAGSLPVYLKKSYHFLQSSILGTPCLILFPKSSELPSPSKLGKHIQVLADWWPGQIIIVGMTVTAYQRKKLIESKISFVIPDTQLYIPVLGVSLREYYAAITETREVLSPSAQVLLLYLIYHGDRGFTPGELVEPLAYSLMTLTRAARELEAATLITTEKKGTERWITPVASGSELWQMARDHLGSPVRKTTWIHIPREMIQKQWLTSGINALASYSMIAETSRMIIALSNEQWNTISGQGIQTFTPDDPDSVEVEIWRYRPDLLAKEQMVDPLSLYLSLMDSEDERVQAALDEMLERLTW